MTGIVLLNMGAARSKDELRLFLTNMFNDKNIITVKSNLLRKFIATMIVLTRTNKAWKNYEEIGGKSPLHDITDKVVAKLQERLGDMYVTSVMRYTPNFAKAVVEELKEKGVKEIVLLPMYPQFSTTTTKSSVEDFKEVAKNIFKISTIRPYYMDIDYNKAICESILKMRGNQEDYHLIFSAHGLPQKIVDNKDPYQKQLEKQVAYLKEQLGSKFLSIDLGYQSKVGPMKWLEPSLDTLLEGYVDKKVIVYPIAFTVDNSETVFELEIEYRELADELKVKEFKVCPCLNDDTGFISVLEKLTLNKLNVA